MNLFQKPIDSAIQLAKTASKTVIPEKNNRLFLRNNRLFIPANKLKLKSWGQKDYTQLFILVHSYPELHPVFSEILRKSTKQSPLDHLHHNQENDLEHLKKHTLNPIQHLDQSLNFFFAISEYFEKLFLDENFVSRFLIYQKLFFKIYLRI